MRWKDSRGVILSWDGTTTGESFCLGIERLQGSPSVLVERLQGSPSVLGYNDSRGVFLSWDRMTPGESFHPRTEGLQWSNSVPGMEQLQRSHFVLGWDDSREVNFVLGYNDSWGVILSGDRMTPLESFCPWKEGLQESQSVLGRNDSVLEWNDTR